MREDADAKYLGPFLALSRCIPALSLHNKEKKKKVIVAQVNTPFLDLMCFSVALLPWRPHGFPAGGCEGRVRPGRGEKVLMRHLCWAEAEERSPALGVASSRGPWNGSERANHPVSRHSWSAERK